MVSGLVTTFDPSTASIVGVFPVERRLRQLDGVFADVAAYKAACAAGDPLIYSVASVAPVAGAGQLHYGIGRLMAGRVGQEYFMTRGHYHEWRAAAEIYIGLSGSGLMLLEDENSGKTELLDLLPNSVVYVPGHTAHRTINTGSEPLTYIGIYPAEAGHDYASLATDNFRHVVVDVDGTPTLLLRSDYLAQLRPADVRRPA